MTCRSASPRALNVSAARQAPTTPDRVRFFTIFWLRIRVQKRNAESCQSRQRHSGSMATSATCVSFVLVRAMALCYKCYKYKYKLMSYCMYQCNQSSHMFALRLKWWHTTARPDDYGWVHSFTSSRCSLQATHTSFLQCRGKTNNRWMHFVNLVRVQVLFYDLLLHAFIVLKLF